MLTKQDLGQIQKIVQHVVQEEINPLKKDVSTLKEDVSGLKQDMSSVKKDVSTLKEDVSEIRKDVKTVVKFFDREYLELRKRVERIETHLNLQAAS